MSNPQREYETVLAMWTRFLVFRYCFVLRFTAACHLYRLLWQCGSGSWPPLNHNPFFLWSLNTTLKLIDEYAPGVTKVEWTNSDEWNCKQRYSFSHFQGRGSNLWPREAGVIGIIPPTFDTCMKAALDRSRPITSAARIQRIENLRKYAQSKTILARSLPYLFINLYDAQIWGDVMWFQREGDEEFWLKVSFV